MAALLLLALPLAVAAWGLGALSAKRARSNADQALVRDLNHGAAAYARQVQAADQRAGALARSQEIARALSQRDLRKLRTVQRAHPWILLRPGAGGGVRATHPQASFEVVDRRGRTIGRVLVVAPIGSRLAGQIARVAGLPEDRLGFVVGDRFVRGNGAVRVLSPPRASNSVGDARLQGTDVRAVDLPLGQSGAGAALMAVRDRAAIAAAAADARWRTVGLGLALIAALLLLAYALAPVVARTRISRLQRDYAERVLAHLGDGVFVVDAAGVVRLWNKAAEAITGLRSAEVCGRRAEESIPGWATIATFVPVADRPGQREGGTSSETVPVDVAGRELWLSFEAVTLDEHTVYAFRDATHDHRLEELRSQFVATISHEIRTPLASLHGAALTLREHDDLPAQTRDDLLEMIAEQSNRLANLVEEILVAGQLDSGSLSVVVDSFDAEELVRGVVTAVRSRVGEERAIEVVHPPVVPNVHGDAERTRQVLLNLLDNAIKYSPSRGKIEVELAPVDDRLRFTVRDEGLGIPAGEQERIFDKFYRLDPDQRRGIGGTGLGLYICRELVRSMHGRIWVESAPGKGTVFGFELPAEPVPAAV